MREQDTGDLIDDLVTDWRAARPATEPEAMHVVGRIIRLARRYEQDVTNLLKPHGLSYSDFDVLATLRRSGTAHALTPTELQKNVLLTSGAMTACLYRLERAGLISREAGQNDRRRLSARLTDRGLAVIEALIDRRFALASEALKGLSASEVGTAERLLRKLGAD